MEIGSKAPELKLTDKNGRRYSLADFKKPFLIIYFYPKDNTPGCTIQAQNFNKNLARLKTLGADIVGISGGTDNTKEQFCSKNKLDLLLLSDTDFSVSKAYDSFGKKSFMGMKFNGIFRNTYVFDKARKLIKVFEGAKPDTNTEEVMKFIESQAKKVPVKLGNTRLGNVKFGNVNTGKEKKMKKATTKSTKTAKASKTATPAKTAGKNINYSAAKTNTKGTKAPAFKKQAIATNQKKAAVTTAAAFSAKKVPQTKSTKPTVAATATKKTGKSYAAKKTAKPAATKGKKATRSTWSR